MVEPRIQYAKTEDGVNIAYWTLGQGTAFIQMPGPPWSHIQMAWEWPESRRWTERIAQKRQFVTYDNRESGLSDRDVADHSLDAHVQDLEAVVDRLGLERFVLHGFYHSGPVAIAYAVRHPERVSHLILMCSYARAPDYSELPQTQAFRPLIDDDWTLYTETRAHMAMGYSGGEDAHRFAAFMRECVTPQAAQAIYEAMDKFDVTDLLSEVQSPTLVLHRREIGWLDAGVARGLASRIPGARLALLEGASIVAWVGDEDAVVEAIDEFLSEGDEEGNKSAPFTPSGLVTILFTDMESSTALRRKLGDAQVQELVRAHNEIVRTALGEHAGREIKHTGDGIMSSFTTATSALECSIAIQRGVASHAEEHPDAPLGVYVGLNAGEPIAEEDDLFGTSVDLARRICDHAEPGQILASNVVRELAEGKGFLFGDIGDVVPKGFEEPVRLYEVRWRAEGSP